MFDDFNAFNSDNKKANEKHLMNINKFQIGNSNLISMACTLVSAS